MTLVIAALTTEYAVQISDRRLSVGGRTDTDEANKALIFRGIDGRLVGGFTGPGRIDAGRDSVWVDEWFAATLLDCAPPDYHCVRTIERFIDRASLDFKSRQNFRRLPAAERRASFHLCGFVAGASGPIGVAAYVTNFEDLPSGVAATEAWPEFRWGWARNPIDYVQVLGWSSAVSTSNLDELRNMVTAGKPAEAIVGKGVEVLREAIPRSRGTVGPQVNSIVVPSDSNLPDLAQYHSATPSATNFEPTIVEARSPGAFASRLELTRVDDPAYKGPKLGRNVPCWCGSGVKYKNCHARTDRPTEGSSFRGPP